MGFLGFLLLLILIPIFLVVLRLLFFILNIYHKIRHGSINKDSTSTENQEKKKQAFDKTYAEDVEFEEIDT